MILERSEAIEKRHLFKGANEFRFVFPHPFFSIRVKFGTRDMVIILLSICGFRENRLS